MNFHRVTLHFEFGVSPLEIGGFGAVPPSPPETHEKRALVARFSFLSLAVKGRRDGHCAIARGTASDAAIPEGSPPAQNDVVVGRIGQRRGQFRAEGDGALALTQQLAERGGGGFALRVGAQRVEA